MTHRDQSQDARHPDTGPGIPAGMTRRTRFLRAARCQPLDYPPIWMMRQAGRALPEYRKLKETYTFLQLVQNPELATEVTLQPLRRFDFDAAILFSDILVIPEAMGQAYEFREGGGVQMAFTVQSAQDVGRLNELEVVQRLDYVAQALRLLRRELGDRHALIGFSGAPWTLANFMLEGGSCEAPTKALALYRENRPTFDALMEKLTGAVIAYLRMQIDNGVDAVQLFDSNGGLLPSAEFEAASGVWMRRIVEALGGKVPVIVFSRGTHGSWPSLVNTGAQVIGVDWEIPIAEARRNVPGTIALQGNLAPALMSDASVDTVGRETQSILDSMRGRPGHIFNLGHGLPPNAKLENIEQVISTVRRGL